MIIESIIIACALCFHGYMIAYGLSNGSVNHGKALFRIIEHLRPDLNKLFRNADVLTSQVEKYLKEKIDNQKKI